MKKILIFGGTQFVGKRLIGNLLEKNYDLTVVTRGNWPVPFNNSLKHVVADRYDPSTFGSLINQKWDVVVDQLAFYGHDAKILIDAFEGKTKKFICVTSNAVYDNGLNLKERDFEITSMDESKIDFTSYREPKVDTPEYQMGKREVEFVYSKCTTPVTLVRFPIILGMDDLSLRFYNLYKMIKNKEELKIEDPNRKQSFINSREAARFLSFCIDQEINGPVNACLDGEFSLEMMERVMGKSIHYCVSTEPNSFLTGNEVTLNNEYANSLGFKFENLEEYLRELVILYGFFSERL